MFDNDLTLNANAFTGVSTPRVHSLISIEGSRSTRSCAALATTTPSVLDVQHGEAKKGKATYLRSTVGLRRSEIPAGASPAEDVKAYEHSVRITIERPKNTTVISSAEIATQLGELLSVFGISLSVSGVPTAALTKFLNKEP